MFRTTKCSKTVLIHASAWIVYYAYEYVIVGLIAYYKVNFIESVFNFPLYIVLFYFCTQQLFSVYLNQKRYFQFFIYTLLTVVVFTYLRYEVKVTFVPLVSDEALRYPYKDLRLFLAETLYRGSYFFMIAFGYWFATKSIKQEKEKRWLEQQKRMSEQHLRIAEINLRDAEIAYLKNQINPHFLFNTLNFFYDQISMHSKQIAEGMLLLSDIMRYALKKSDDDKVMLEDEIEHLRNYIAINQLRYSNQLQICFKVVGDPAFRLIMPLMLITFVENCFKYGDLLDSKHPLYINIEITNQQLIFYAHNKKKTGPVESSTGIGISNTKQRLDVIYEDRYSLEIEDGLDFYSTTLTVDL